jgi:hypothetical protein
MASALHADFARLRARGIETTLAPLELRATSEPLLPTVAAAPVPPGVTPEATSPRSGWLARLRGR